MLDGSNVEPKLDDVAVLHNVFFALDAELAGLAGFALGAERDEIVERDGLGGDEAAQLSKSILNPKSLSDSIDHFCAAGFLCFRGLEL